jgi:hypothetical protein
MKRKIFYQLLQATRPYAVSMPSGACMDCSHTKKIESIESANDNLL